MGYFVGLVSLVLGGITLKMYKNVLNPVCFFSLLWGCVCILSQMRLYGFTGANSYGYFIILVGVLSYGLGSLFIINKKKSIQFKIGGKNKLYRYSKYQSNRNNVEQINVKIIWIMMIIVFVYTVYKMKLALPFIQMNNSLGYVRTIYLRVGAGITINALDYFINTFIIAGMRLTCEIVIINELISRRKMHKLLCLMMLLIVVMNVLLSGGRMILFDMVTYILFAIKLNGFRTKHKLNLRQKILVLLIIIITILGMIYITKDRQSNSSLLESIYGNFIGGVSLFNTIVNDVLEKRWTYGFMFLYAIVSIIWMPLNYLFNIPYPPMFDTFDMLVSPFYDVGKIRMNAYITCWSFFYSDFRLIGIVIFSMIFGIIAAISYNRYKKTRSAENTCKYMLMLNILMYSIIRWQLCNSAYLLTFILLSVVYKNANHYHV